MRLFIETAAKTAVYGTIILLLILLALHCTARAQEPRVMVIEGVEYRLFNAEEMRDILKKLKERELFAEDNKKLEAQLTEAIKKFDEAQKNRDETVLLVTRKLEGERDYWKEQFEAERLNSSRLESIFRSCTGRVLWLFRVCRL